MPIKRKEIKALSELDLNILGSIDQNTIKDQRALSKIIGTSLGKVNYCLKALINKGFMKVGNFKRNTQKLSYLYLLTPSGLEEKARLTASFLKRKVAEHEKITEEIEQLKQDISS